MNSLYNSHQLLWDIFYRVFIMLSIPQLINQEKSKMCYWKFKKMNNEKEIFLVFDFHLRIFQTNLLFIKNTVFPFDFSQFQKSQKSSKVKNIFLLFQNFFFRWFFPVFFPKKLKRIKTQNQMFIFPLYTFLYTFFFVIPFGIFASNQKEKREEKAYERRWLFTQNLLIFRRKTNKSKMPKIAGKREEKNRRRTSVDAERKSKEKNAEE